MRRGIHNLLGLAAIAAATEPTYVRVKRPRTHQRPWIVTGALFNTEADARRAIKRAKRWLKYQSRGPADVPPRHIFANAELAAFQFKGIEATV